MKKILVLGDICTDHYYYIKHKSFNPEGDYPIFEVVKQEHRPGMALNVAEALKKLGNYVVCLSDVKEPKIQKIRVVDAETNKVLERIDIDTYKPDFQTVDKLYKEDTARFDAIIISDYGKGAINDWQLQRLNKLFKYNVFDCPVFIDPKNRTISEYVNCLRDIKELIFTPNIRESEDLLFGYIKDNGNYILDIRKAMKFYSQKVPQVSFLFKKSETGLEWMDKEGFAFPIPALKKPYEVVDVCGAGDITLAAFVHAKLISPSNSPNAWLKYANAAASICVGKLGNYCPTDDEIIEEVKKYG